MSLDHAGWARLYRVLAGLGLGQPTTPVRLFDADGTATGPTLPIGWSDLKVAIHFDHDDTGPFEKDDWTLVPMPAHTAKALTGALQWIDDVAFAYTLRQSEKDAVATVSQHERVLLHGLLRAGLPEPDRNLRIRRDDNTTLTIPDFAWSDRMLAVFLDGHHWHGGKSLDDLIRQAAHANGDGKPDPKRRKAVKERWKNKSALDAERRRQMTAAGWTVIAVSDADIDPKQPDSVLAMVGDIAATFHRLGATPAA